MRQIETTEEMLACHESIRELGWDPDDEYPSFVLRQMWCASRDWHRAQAEREIQAASQRLEARRAEREASSLPPTGRTIAGSIAAQALAETIDKGGTIEIPSLGITLSKKDRSAPADAREA